MTRIDLDFSSDWPRELLRLERFLCGEGPPDRRQLVLEQTMSAEERAREEAVRARWLAWVWGV